jgi:putative endopeptidase
MVLIFSLLMSSCSHGSVVEDKVLDQTVDPCVDFFQYSCGNWLKENSIPNGETSWYRSSSIDLLNQKTLSGVLEKYRKGDFNPYQKDAEKLKDLYASCMNYDKQDYKAKKELAKLLIKIKSIKNKKAIMGLLGELHLIGLRPFFSFSVSPRMDNSSLIFASIDQGGFGLPDTTFYTSNKENDVLIQKKYFNTCQSTFNFYSI